MLEIAILCWYGGKLGEVARAKGRRAGWYQFLLVVVWIMAECVGLIAGAALETRLQFGEPLLKYLMALAWAGLAAWLLHQFVASLSSLNAAEETATLPAPPAAAVSLPPDDGNPYRAPL
jgi:hypothetical protein